MHLGLSTVLKVGPEQLLELLKPHRVSPRCPLELTGSPRLLERVFSPGELWRGYLTLVAFPAAYLNRLGRRTQWI
jgi:hypothetical protein